MFDIVATSPRPEIGKWFLVEVPIQGKGAFTLEIYHNSAWSLEVVRQSPWVNSRVIKLEISMPNPKDEDDTYVRAANLLFDPVTQAEREKGYWVRVSSFLSPFACLVFTSAGVFVRSAKLKPSPHGSVILYLDFLNWDLTKQDFFSFGPAVVYGTVGSAPVDPAWRRSISNIKLHWYRLFKVPDFGEEDNVFES